MVHFKTKTTHTEESIHILARMQYDVFCIPQKIITYILSIALIIIGIYLSNKWYGIMYLFIGCLIITSTYVQSNYAANKICNLIKESGKPFPSSRFLFYDDYVEIFSNPENVSIGKIDYKSFIKFSEDKNAFYLFPHKNGGYVIFKNALLDNADNVKNENDFREFLSKKSNMKVIRINEPPIIKLINKINNMKKN